MVTSAMGSKGGQGGLGAKGGAGAGGPSYGAVLTGGAVLVEDNTTFTPDKGGAGLDGAPNGDAAPKLSL